MRFVQKAEEQNGALAPIVCVQKAVLASKGLRGVYKVVLDRTLTLMALTSIQRSVGWISNPSTDRMATVPCRRAPRWRRMKARRAWNSMKRTPATP